MADEAEKEKGPPANPLDAAADRLRDSAKWLLASFGAVAAVIFAGLTIADLGELNGDTPDYRFAIAIAGASAAIVGIVAALTRTMGLAGASTTSLEDLVRASDESELLAARGEVEFDPAMRTWDGDFGAFLEAYRDVYDEYLLRAEAYATAPAKRPDPSALNKAKFQLDVMSSIATRLLRTVGFLRLQRAFTNARRVIAGWIVLTAAGAVAFGWATSGVPDEAPDLVDRPTAAMLQPSEDVVAELNRQLPARCEVEIGEDVNVVVLSDDEAKQTVQLVTVPDDGCPPVRATASSNEVSES